MPERPKYEEALRRVMELTYPPTTLRLPPERAVGHRLAKAITAKGSLPTRPFALVDGLALIARDIVVGHHSQLEEVQDEANAAEPGAGEPSQTPSEDVGSASEEAPEDVDQTSGAPETDASQVLDEAPEDAAPPSASPPPSPTVELELRPFPQSNRKEDALRAGQAIAIPVGGEVPRGGQLIYPLADLFTGIEDGPSTSADEQADSAPGEPSDEAADTNAEESADENNDLPAPEPVRDWDLPSHNQRGRVTLPRLAEPPPENMVPIGAWARNRETILPEKTIIRPPELALLAALDVEEIEVYRRPVVGVASLGPPFPQAGKESAREAREGTCPLQTLVVQLARSARVAALPLGFAPPRFRPLTAAVRRWVKQVDLLLLVGGSHHGPRSLGNDVLTAIGEPQLTGLNLTPGGGLSAGKVGNRPLIVMPGSLPDVLCGFVLLVRPLAHKYLTPHHYSCEVDLVLERGSQLRMNKDTAVPVRFGFSQERQAYATHYAGQQQDPWLDFIRGQALVVLERDRQYEDGETVTAYTY